MSHQKETYLTNTNVKRDGIVQSWNAEDVKTYHQCMNDPVYFTQNFIKIISLDTGLIPFNLYKYQKRCLKNLKRIDLALS
ncbi:MAG: hypothetical protein CMC59_07710 [Flavobacteriaceae bacterium]|nr:hypothetical protein [Flavobacteriaceae bacterium]